MQVGLCEAETSPESEDQGAFSSLKCYEQHLDSRTPTSSSLWEVLALHGGGSNANIMKYQALCEASRVFACDCASQVMPLRRALGDLAPRPWEIQLYRAVFSTYLKVFAVGARHSRAERGRLGLPEWREALEAAWWM